MESENDQPSRASGTGLWGVLTAVVVVLTLTLCGWYSLIFMNPYSPLNPLPPGTVTPYPLLEGPTAPPTSSTEAPPTSAVDPGPATPNPTAPQSAVATLTPAPGVVVPSPTAQPGLPTVTAGPSPTAGTVQVEPTRGGGDPYPGGQQPTPTEGSGYPPQTP